MAEARARQGIYRRDATCHVATKQGHTAEHEEMQKMLNNVLGENYAIQLQVLRFQEELRAQSQRDDDDNSDTFDSYDEGEDEEDLESLEEDDIIDVLDNRAEDAWWTDVPEVDRRGDNCPEKRHDTRGLQEVDDKEVLEWINSDGLQKPSEALLSQKQGNLETLQGQHESKARAVLFTVGDENRVFLPSSSKFQIEKNARGNGAPASPPVSKDAQRSWTNSRVPGTGPCGTDRNGLLPSPPRFQDGNASNTDVRAEPGASTSQKYRSKTLTLGHTLEKHDECAKKAQQAVDNRWNSGSGERACDNWRLQGRSAKGRAQAGCSRAAFPSKQSDEEQDEELDPLEPQIEVESGARGSPSSGFRVFRRATEESRRSAQSNASPASQAQAAQVAETWLKAQAVLIRKSGIFLQLASEGHAWLPFAGVKPPLPLDSAEIIDMMQKPIRVRTVASNSHLGHPSASMWTVEEERDIFRARARELLKVQEARESHSEQIKAQLRPSFDPRKWMDGLVTSVKPGGIFAMPFPEVPEVILFIPTKDIPQELVVGQGKSSFPDIVAGETVKLRIVAYLGKDESGKDRWKCTMMPLPRAAAAVLSASTASVPVGKGKGCSKGPFEGHSVWTPGRCLESESTLARQEAFEVNTLTAEDLAKRYGPTDRKAYLARKGFAVVDYSTAMQLQKVCKASEQKAEKAAERPAERPLPLQVWLRLDGKSRLLGSMRAMATTDLEKETMAVDMAIREANHLLQNGGNIDKVDCTEHGVLIQLRSGGGLRL